jgi:pyruvate carboxylase
MRTADMLHIADAIAHRTPELFSLEMWGGATFDTAMRFLREDPWNRLRQLREAVPNICFQMLFRGSNAVGYSDYPDNVVKAFVKHAAESGMDIFRIFDSLNYLPNLKAAMEAVRDTHAVCEGTICYTGNILDAKRDKYPLKYYVKLAKELEKMGAHTLCIKDMAGLCRPYAAHKLVKTLRGEVGLPIHFHTHDTSGVNAASVLKASEAGVDIADLAIASLSGSTSQPNLNSVVAALDHTPRETGLSLGTLNEFSDYWEQVRKVYAPFDTGPRSGIGDIYEHEMPGGQYTNLREQAESMGLGARWKEVARTYAEVNDLFGDIVKVTPSSKVVGDMTMFLVTRGIKPADVVNLEPGATPFPQSVIDMMKGRLGKPLGGWPRKVQQVVLGKQKPLKGRPGADLKPLNLERTRKKLEGEIHRKVSDDALLCYLMYPEVFRDYNKFRREYGDVSVLPSSTYFYGLKPGEEIAVDIEVGKTLYIKLINLSTPDEDGLRALTFELNGYPREVEIADASLNVHEKVQAKADPGNDLHVGAPIPGIITELAVGVGAKVAKGDKLLTMEAMKMQTTVYAAADGVVDAIHIDIGESVEAKDLVMELRER